MTTLKVPGSWLSVVAVWSSTVENECERTCASRPVVGSAWGCCWKALPSFRSGSGGVGSEWGVLEPYRLCSHSLLVGRSLSRVALSGGVWGEKTKGSG